MEEGVSAAVTAQIRISISLFDKTAHTHTSPPAQFCFSAHIFMCSLLWNVLSARCLQEKNVCFPSSSLPLLSVLNSFGGGVLGKQLTVLFD